MAKGALGRVNKVWSASRIVAPDSVSLHPDYVARIEGSGSQGPVAKTPGSHPGGSRLGTVIQRRDRMDIADPVRHPCPGTCTYSFT